MSSMNGKKSQYKHGKHCAMVQLQYEYEHGPLGTRPVLTMLNHCTRGTRTVHTMQEYMHGTSTKTGKTYITRAGQARPLYKRYKHGTHCAVVQQQHGTSTKTGKTYITRAGHARPLYKRYKHGTHCAMVQLQYEYEHGLAESLYKGYNTIHTLRRYKYSTSTNAGK